MFDVIIQVVVEIIILPVTLALATPVVLILGFFGENSYLENIKESYGKIVKWWKKHIF